MGRQKLLEKMEEKQMVQKNYGKRSEERNKNGP